MNVSNNKAEKEMEQTKPIDENVGLKCRGHIRLEMQKLKKSLLISETQFTMVTWRILLQML